ncbi:piggyBac transposable element-derived protein 4-like [Ixodes scapularis]|uniref:piggyBac transposable element-derived protein 4-like n=1 Tax=Ixodes scapularis TaxID=6945 RepID=UPI001A9FBBE9|nr:piggyBac transposable element-derived protein 4-like [Ixodes scapularis]
MFSPNEVMQCIGVLIYMGIVELPRLHLYWNTSELFSGLILPKIMARSRFFAFLAFLSVMDPEKTDAVRDGKLHRITHLLQHMNDVSCQHFQPYRNLCVDERMVKSKGRSGIRQYMRDKGVKWGYKLWVLADSSTGYTVQFSVYTGKRETPSSKGLAYDVVTRLCDAYLDQGYIIYLDNFYTSTSLFEHLLERKTLSCGTTRKDRRGFPSQLKDTTWEKRATRGDIRWLRCRDVLYLQWKDKRTVNMMSTAHTANNHVSAMRKVKRGDRWTRIPIRKPLIIEDYNKGMLGVDKSDQLIASYNVLMKCVRWWKTLFFHCIDIAVVNSFVIFQEHREHHPEIEELTRKTGFDQLAFRIELVNQIFGMDDRHVHPPPPPKKSEHKPQVQEKRRNCKLCYEKKKVERKTAVFCEPCGVYPCFIPTRDCFGGWHATHPR